MADLNANDIEAAAADRGHRPLDGHRGRRLGPRHRTRGSPPARRATIHPADEGEAGTPAEKEERHGQHGKKYLEAAKLVDRERHTRPTRRPQLVKETTTVKFDATIEAHLRLGVDPRHADQMVRGTVVLPHGTGKIVRVAVFAQGEKAQEALRAGADEVGGEDLVKKIEAGWLEFDVALATPDLDGHGRAGSARSSAARPDAEPQGRHDHVRPRAGDPRGQGRPRRVQGRQGGDHPRRRSARAASRPRRSSTTSPRSSTRSTGPSRRAPRASTCRTPDDRQHDGPGHPGRRPGVLAAAPPDPAGSPADHAMAAERRPPDQGRRRRAIGRRRPRAHFGRERGEPTEDGHGGESDGPPQTACARGPPDLPRRDGRGLIRRTGPDRPPTAGPGTTTSTPRQDGASTSRVGAPLQPGSRLLGGPSQGSRPSPAEPPPPRAGRAPKQEEGTMPTEAKRETVAELREELREARTMIVSEYRGLTVKEIAEIRRALRKQDVTLPRRQEPADADRRRGHGRRGAQPAPHRPDRDRVRDRTRRRPPRPSSTRPARTTGSCGSRAASSATGRSTPTPSRASPPCRRARSCSPSWPAACRRRSATAGRPVRRAAAQPGLRPAQVAEQKAEAEGRARDPTRTNRPRHDQGDDIPWQP